MRTYYDTGALIKLYLPEQFSDTLTDYVAAQKEPVALHAFHELELENALQLKVFRKEITEQECRGVLRRINDDIRDGMLVKQPVHWLHAMNEAVRVSAAATERSGCRTLDVLHVALALLWKCSLFVSLDHRQIKAASLAHLRVLDVRTL